MFVEPQPYQYDTVAALPRQSVFWQLLGTCAVLLVLMVTPNTHAAEINLQWNPAVGDNRVAGYEVHYGPDSGQYATMVDINGASTSNRTVSNLNEGQTYYFAVRSRNSDRTLLSEFSNELSATISQSGNPTTYTLTVSKTGTGTGTVSSTPAGISCGADCQSVYDEGTAIQLTATPSAGSSFGGWSGHSDCSDGDITMGGNRSCSANFIEDNSGGGGPVVGLVAAYGFEEGTGTGVVDASGNGNDGTLAGATRTGAGRFGNALSFDGSNDQVNLGNLDVSGGNGLTIAFWMRADDFGTYDARLNSKATGANDQDHYWMVSTFSSNSVRFRLKANGSTTTLISNSGVIAADQWHYVAATYDESRMRIYVDGVDVGSTSKSGAVNTNGNVPASLGNQPQGGKPFDGRMDEVRLYNRALTANEIQDAMSAPVGGGSSTPSNQVPSVNAGANQTITLPMSANLDGTVNDDGLPNPPASVSLTWSKVSGPGTVTFDNVSAVDTTANFSTAGTYTLRLRADDGALSNTDEVTITVNTGTASGDLPWVEQFNQSNGTTVDTGATGWSVNTSACQSPFTFSVQNNRFEANNTDGECIWSSAQIDISEADAVTVSVNIDDTDNNKESSDYLRVYYKLNGGSETLLGQRSGNISSETLSGTGLSGNSLQVIIKTRLSGGSEYYNWDNVSIVETGGGGGNSGGSAFQQDGNGRVSMEAESFDTNTPKSGRNWNPVTNPTAGFSGSGVLRALPDAGLKISSGYTATSPHLEYAVDFVSTGIHYVWIRGHGGWRRLGLCACRTGRPRGSDGGQYWHSADSLRMVRRCRQGERHHSRSPHLRPVDA